MDVILWIVFHHEDTKGTKNFPCYFQELSDLISIFDSIDAVLAFRQTMKWRTREDSNLRPPGP